MKLREHTFYVCIFMVKCLIVFAYREVMRQYRSEKVKYLTQSYSKIWQLKTNELIGMIISLQMTIHCKMFVILTKSEECFQVNFYFSETKLLSI